MNDEGQLEKIIQIPDQLDPMLHHPEISAWVESIANCLSNRSCKREEIAWILEVPDAILSEALPRFAEEAQIGTTLNLLGFVPRGTGCLIRNLKSKTHLNGRKATICVDLHARASHAVLIVDGGLEETKGTGDKSKSIEISRANLQFAMFPEAAEKPGSNYPPTSILSPTMVRMLENSDKSRKCVTLKTEEILGKLFHTALLPIMRNRPLLDWIGRMVGRLVDGCGTTWEEIVYILDLDPNHHTALSVLGGPHAPLGLDLHLVGSSLDKLGFIPQESVVMVQDTEREDLNGKLGELWEYCPPGQVDVRVGIVTDGEEVWLPRRNLRLLPLPGPTLALKIIPFGTRCVVTGSKTRPDLNNQRVMVLEDCEEKQAHARVYGEGVGEVQIHRKNLRVAKPAPPAWGEKLPTEHASNKEDLASLLQRFGSTDTIGSINSKEDTGRGRRPSHASILEQPDVRTPKAQADKNDSAQSGSTESTKDKESLITSKTEDGAASKAEPSSAELSDKEASERKSSKKSDGKSASDDDKSEKGSVTSSQAGSEKAKSKGFLEGLLTFLACASSPKEGCGTACCGRESAQDDVDAAAPLAYASPAGADPEVDILHSSMSPFVVAVPVNDKGPQPLDDFKFPGDSSAETPSEKEKREEKEKSNGPSDPAGQLSGRESLEQVAESKQDQPKSPSTQATAKDKETVPQNTPEHSRSHSRDAVPPSPDPPQTNGTYAPAPRTGSPRGSPEGPTFTGVQAAQRTHEPASHVGTAADHSQEKKHGMIGRMFGRAKAR